MFKDFQFHRIFIDLIAKSKQCPLYLIDFSAYLKNIIDFSIVYFYEFRFSSIASRLFYLYIYIYTINNNQYKLLFILLICLFSVVLHSYSFYIQTTNINDFSIK